MSKESIKTSVTHPLRIDEVNLLRGQIGITFCPGKHQEDAQTGQWDRDLKMDLHAIQNWKAQAIVCLIEKEEMTKLGVEDLPELAPKYGLEFFHLPIPDGHAPTPEFDENWHHVEDKLYRILENGGRILVHCKGGLGRAGTIAAKMLIENGISAKDAIGQVRRARSRNAIETDAQVHYLMQLGESSVRSFSSKSKTMKRTDMTLPTILLSPLKPAIPARGGAIDILVRVQGPDQPQASKTEITPKRLALVVDRSGSMSGQPLHEALKCVEHIASCMTADDRISVVVYDDNVNVLMPLGSVTSQETMKRLLSKVEDGGSTNLFGGWEEGAKQLEKGQDTSISRVILLSDGQANHGLLDQAAIEKHCREWLAKGVSTTTVGLGRGFNENLMIIMAKAGGGQQYYGQTATDLFDSFDEELSLLQALCLRQLSLKLIPVQGVIIEPLGVFDQNVDGTYQLSDLAWGAESWLAVRLHISPMVVGKSHDLLAATVQGKALDGQIISAHAAILSLPAMEQAAIEAMPADEVVQRRLQEVDFAKSSLDISRLVNAGDVTAARVLVKDLEMRFGQHPWLRAKLTRLRELAERDPEMMSKEVRFNSRKMSKRLVANQEVAFSVDETNMAMPAFLRKKSEEGKGRKGPDDTTP